MSFQDELKFEVNCKGLVEMFQVRQYFQIQNLMARENITLAILTRRRNGYYHEDRQRRIITFTFRFYSLNQAMFST